MTPDDTTTTTATRRRLLRTGGAALATIGTAGLYTSSAAADEAPPMGVLADGFEVETDHSAFFRGFFDGVGSRFGRYDPVEELAGHAQNEFNANARAWIDYGNWLLDTTEVASPGTTVVDVDLGVSRIPFRSPRNIVETHIYAEYDDRADEFVELEWNDGFAEDEADYHVGLRNQAARNAGDELLAFRKRYIGDSQDEHELPDDEFLNELAGTYASSLRLGEESRSILELLLGDLDGE